MATSGRAQGNSISYGDYFFVDWQLTGQSVEGNYSTINWQAYWHFSNSDRQLDSGNVVINGGQVWANGGRIYNYAGNFATRNMLLASGSATIGHNADGGKVFNINGSTLGFENERSSTSVNWELPAINRYINITGYSLSAVTEKSVNVNVSVSGTAAAVDYSLNGGGWQRGFTGGFTSRTFTINNLNPATAYSIRIRVQNASGGLWTESGVQSATTVAVVITTVSVPATTDTTATIQATTNYVADLLQIRETGTTTWTDRAGAFTTTTIQATGLTADDTYTYDVRARHQDSQTYTPIRTVTFSTGLPQPLQATQLTPGNGEAVGTLLPTFDWQYNATSIDAQSAYQVLLQLVSDASTVWDSTKVTSSTTQVTLPGTVVLDYNVDYQWAVKTWSGSGIEGTYSDLTTFKVSEAPVVTITAPTDGSTISTDIPTITWTYSDPEATAQTAYRILITESGSTVYDKTVNNSDDTSFDVPLRVLQNNHSYVFTVSATDGDGIVGTSDPVDVIVSFIAPPVPTIRVETSTDNFFNYIEVGTTKPDNDSFGTDSINVWKREVGDAEWTFLSNIPTTPQYIGEFQDDAAWTVSGTGAAITESAIARQGLVSLSLSKSSAGSAKMSRTLTLNNVIQNDRQRIWIYVATGAAISEVNLRFGTNNANYYKYNIRKDYPLQAITNVYTGSNSIVTDGFHYLLSGHKVTFSTTGTLPAPLVSGQAYYVRMITTSTFTLHPSANAALNNTNTIDLTTAGTGTHSVQPEQLLTEGEWNSIEMDNRAFQVIGTPSLTDIQWREAEIVATAVVAADEVLFDGWHIVPSVDSLYLYDYELANGKTYQYSATSVNSEQLLESGNSTATTPIVIKYQTYRNTYVIPVDRKSDAVVAFMDISDLPSWTTQTDTEYYKPVGRKYPVVYTNGTQKYKTGDMTLQFFDECFNGEGMDGLKSFEEIMNEKPLMVRTYWGEIYYVSIDGSINVTRLKDVGWSATFNFTEIENEQ